MSNESQVMALLEEGNPATEVGDTAWLGMDAAAYLATLPQRSSDMTELDTKTIRRQDPKRPVVPWLVAAAAILMVGVALILTNQGPDDAPVVSQVTPSTVGDAAPTTEPSPGTTLDPAELAWQEIPLWLGGIGTMRSNAFEVPFSFTLDQRWEYLGDVAMKPPDNGPDDGVLAYLHFGLGVGTGTVEETVEAFAAAHELLGGEMTEPVPTNVGGATGVVFESTDLPWELQPGETFPYLAEGRYLIGGGEAMVHIVDVDGTAVAIIYYGLAMFFPDYRNDVQAIIDSITWKDLD